MPKRVWCYYASVAVFFLFVGVAGADSPTRNLAQFASASGNIIYLAAGLGLPLLEDGDHGGVHSLRVADSLAVTLAFTEGLKDITREKRPDSNSHDSFPSGHASAAFTVATVESAIHPAQGPFWFAGATAIGLSRIRLNRHHPQDVVAGALLGTVVGRWEVAQSHGLFLTPWIHKDSPGMRIDISRSW